MFFEDRKFIKVEQAVQQHFRGGAPRVFGWTPTVNASVLAGEAIVIAFNEILQKRG